MDMDEILRRAREAQQKAAEMQRQVASVTVDGYAGGGIVKVTLSGKHELKKLVIDPSLLRDGDAEILEDLIVAAHADAKTKLDALLAEEMAKMASSLGLPPGFGM